MEKFTTLEGVAAPLKMINIDTDMIRSEERRVGKECSS